MGVRREVVVVGAGLSGLVAARALTAAGCTVRVLDKGRGVGGRLATRRVAGARLDHGAQFFTVRGAELAAFVEEATAAGVVQEWCRGFGAPDGFPRYRGTEGMTGIAKYLARDLDVRTGVRVTDLAEHPADAHVLTAPIPQSLAILSFSARLPDPDLADRLAACTYNATLALLVVLDGDPVLPEPGAIQQPDHPVFTFIADNRAKGISDVHAVTFHVADAASRARWSQPDGELRDELLAEARPWLGGAAVRDVQLMRWRYAGPRAPWPAPCVVVHGAPAPVVLAGDAFDGPKFEGAFRSGLAAARAVLDGTSPEAS